MGALEIYAENILEHYKNPRNFGKLEEADAVAQVYNPLCGDVLALQLKFSDGKIGDAKFLGKGCAISQAAASMLTERVKGMDKEEAGQISADDVLRMLDVKLSPSRLKCGLLVLEALRNCLKAPEA